MGLKGNVNDLRKLSKRLPALPLSIVHDVSQAAAPRLTTRTNQAFDSGKTVYGQPRPASSDGRPLTLRRTGDTASTLRFVSNGTIVRCVLGTPYARYLIGKYRILPMGAMPTAWASEIQTLTATIAKASILDDR